MSFNQKLNTQLHQITQLRFVFRCFVYFCLSHGLTRLGETTLWLCLAKSRSFLKLRAFRLNQRHQVRLKVESDQPCLTSNWVFPPLIGGCMLQFGESDDIQQSKMNERWSIYSSLLVTTAVWLCAIVESPNLGPKPPHMFLARKISNVTTPAAGWNWPLCRMWDISGWTQRCPCNPRCGCSHQRQQNAKPKHGSKIRQNQYRPKDGQEKIHEDSMRMILFIWTLFWCSQCRYWTLVADFLESWSSLANEFGVQKSRRSSKKERSWDLVHSFADMFVELLHIFFCHLFDCMFLFGYLSWLMFLFGCCRAPQLNARLWAYEVKME